MSQIEIALQIITTIVGLIGGGVGIYFWRVNRELKQQEVEKAAIENEMTQAGAWRGLYEQEHAKCEQKSAEKRELYAERDRLRDANSKKDLRIEQLCWYYCTRPNCDKRNPPHRFDERGYEIHAETFDNNKKKE
ncbi:MAG: hypothetical protein IJR42_01420 [Paludibacteraceae bacterium]|nr:hypothetical protein [Paludibacteraceae bacterium]